MLVGLFVSWSIKKKRLSRFESRDQLYGTKYLESRYYTYITRVLLVAEGVANIM